MGKIKKSNKRVTKRTLFIGTGAKAYEKFVHERRNEYIHIHILYMNQGEIDLIPYRTSRCTYKQAVLWIRDILLRILIRTTQFQIRTLLCSSVAFKMSTKK
jgi:hypothetical protein